MPQPARAQLGHLVIITARPGLALRTQLALLSISERVEVVATLRRGLSILRHRPPDAVLLDRAAAIEPSGDVEYLG